LETAKQEAFKLVLTGGENAAQAKANGKGHQMLPEPSACAFIRIHRVSRIKLVFNCHRHRNASGREYALMILDFR